MSFISCDQKLVASGRRKRAREEPTPEDRIELMGTLQEMAYAMREQATTAHWMMDQIGRQLEEGHGGNPNRAEFDLEYLKFVVFRKANLPSFWGTFNLDKAEQWIMAMEKIFLVLVCIEYQKVAFATYMLEVDVEFWWTNATRLLEGD